MDTVKEPLWIKSSGNSICIVDDGYSWLQHFPQDKHFSVTTMFDAGGKVIQWYIDIILRQGITENNIPWLDDLFLDIVVTPSGEAVLLDADELEAALKIGEISKFEYDLAWRESKKLLTQISQNNFGLFRLCENHRQSLLRSTEIL